MTDQQAGWLARQRARFMRPDAAFALAWRAVKEFMETDGELPRGIEWIAVSDLPPETFPDPQPPSRRS